MYYNYITFIYVHIHVYISTRHLLMHVFLNFNDLFMYIYSYTLSLSVSLSKQISVLWCLDVLQVFPAHCRPLLLWRFTWFSPLAVI